MKIKVTDKAYAHIKVGQGHYRGDNEWPLPTLEAIQYMRTAEEELISFNTNCFCYDCDCSLEFEEP